MTVHFAQDTLAYIQAPDVIGQDHDPVPCGWVSKHEVPEEAVIAPMPEAGVAIDLFQADPQSP